MEGNGRVVREGTCETGLDGHFGDGNHRSPHSLHVVDL